MRISRDGSRRVLGDPNVKSLIDSSKRWLIRALRSSAEPDDEAAALFGALALEHLGKALLWTSDKFLVITARDASVDPEPEGLILAEPGLRTASLGEVLKRVAQQVGFDPLPASHKMTLIQCRDGIAHVGSGSDAGIVIHDAIRAIDICLNELDIPLEEFYGPAAGLADDLRKRGAERTSQRVRQLMGEAQRSLRLFEKKNGAAAQSVAIREFEYQKATALMSSAVGELAREEMCPVCRHACLLIGLGGVGRDPFAVGAGMEEYPGEFFLYFLPTGLRCAVCRLTLSGGDELTSAKVESYQSKIYQSSAGRLLDPHHLAPWPY